MLPINDDYQQIEYRKQLENCKPIIEFIRDIHNEYGNIINIEDKTGFTASFIVLARVIKLLFSIHNDLENNRSTSGMLNIRHVYEANSLSYYFKVGEFRKNETVLVNIQKWFNNEIIDNSTVRSFLAKELSFDKTHFTQLYQGYSGVTHHIYRSIMKSYNSSIWDGKNIKIINKQGFEYDTEPFSLNLLELIELYKKQIFTSLTTLDICLMVIIAPDELLKLKQYQQELKEIKNLLTT